MGYDIYEIPSGGGLKSDIVVADPDNLDSPTYIHYSYTIGSSINANELKRRRTIPLRNLRDWQHIFTSFPEVRQRFRDRQAY